MPPFWSGPHLVSRPTPKRTPVDARFVMGCRRPPEGRGSTTTRRGRGKCGGLMASAVDGLIHPRAVVSAMSVFGKELSKNLRSRRAGSLDGAGVWCRQENRPLSAGHASVLGREPWGWNHENRPRRPREERRRGPDLTFLHKRRDPPNPMACRTSPKSLTTSRRSKRRSTTRPRSAAAYGSPICSSSSISLSQQEP
jgi:hypothetical protein